MMYYPQQSPSVSHKLSAHHDQNQWARHPALGPPGSQPSVGPPPPSPGYPLYSNGSVSQMQHLQHHHSHALTHPPMVHHHHQNSLTHFPSPPNGHAHAHQQHVLPGSPANVQAQVMSPHWQQQLMKCESIRNSRSPFHRARQTGEMTLRTITKSAIPITNPNAVRITSDPNGDVPAPPGTPSNADGSPRSAAAVNHPSSTVAPVAEAHRPSASRRLESTWNSLDMGGVNIKNLPSSSGLFAYDFLVNLYLNHNSLSTLPPEITRLNHLEVLDLSSNNFTTLPIEIGMLASLKELYVFDNHIQTIPPELGTLHQLQTLGVEGNPLDNTQMGTIQKDGTRALISFLRDTCPVIPPPPERIWTHLINASEREQLMKDPTTETFAVLCYNILCERAATERMYGYTPQWALSWEYRKELILTEVMNYDAEFVCLQEVDIQQYQDYFTKHLEGQGYKGVYCPKARHKTMNETDRKLVDGCATFYKSAKYKLVESQLIEFSALAIQRQDFKKTDDMFNRVLGKDHLALVCLFEHKISGSRLIVSNTHLEWSPVYRDVKLVQAALMVDEIESIAHAFAKYPPKPPTGAEQQPPTYSDGTKIPTIIAGDFNSIPESGVYEYLSTGSLAPNHADFMGHTYGRYTSEGLRHRLSLKSAYSGTMPGNSAGELPFTNYVPSFKGSLSYVWYSSQTLSVNAVLGEVDKTYLERVVGLPNAHFPSDHICIIGEFRVKPPREPPRLVSRDS